MAASRRLLFVLLLVAAGAPRVSAPQSPGQAPAVIDRIVILGNSRTREGVIRRELLFALGDVLDPDRLAESERNLRRLPFLGNVEIRSAVRDGSAEVSVRVQDRYSRALSPLLTGSPDELSYGLVALDYNLGGYGRVARGALEHRAIGGNRAAFELRDDRITGPSGGDDWSVVTTLEVRGDGHLAEASAAQPFRDLRTPRSLGVTTFHLEETVRLYSRGRLSQRYADRMRGGTLWYTRSRGDRVKYRPGLRLTVIDRRFGASEPFDYAPPDQRRVLPSLTFTAWHPAYVKERFVRSLGPVEDLQVGGWLSAQVGLSHRRLGSDRTYGFYAVQVSPGLRLPGSARSFTSLYVAGRASGGGPSNLRARAELLAYVPLWVSSSLALRLRAEAIHRPEDATQLLLGLDSGLRGYAARRFDGRRSLLANVELRPTFYHDGSLTVAGAVFAEAGSVWSPPQPVPVPALSLGTGARLCLPQVYDSPILRADLAYGWRDGGACVSLGIGQYF